jgi:hypothetical protein
MTLFEWKMSRQSTTVDVEEGIERCECWQGCRSETWSQPWRVMSDPEEIEPSQLAAVST